jgi:hypothetical protein
MTMNKIYALVSTIVLFAGVLTLSGCHSQATEAGGVPMPAPHASPPPQAQMQEIDNNPHIPDAQKAAIKANIANQNGGASGQTPMQKP